MAFLLMAALAWFCSRIFSVTQNPVQRITAAEQINSVPRKDHVLPPHDEDSPDIIVETRDVSPAHFLSRIESFSLLSVYGIEKYETREFEAGDYKWRLIIYPNGHQNKAQGNHIAVYLAMVDTSSLPADLELNVIFIISLYNQILDNYLCFRVNGGNGRRFNKTKSIWGFPKFISKKILQDESRGYLVDDNFILGAEVFVLKRQRVIESVTLLEPTQHPQTRQWKIQEFSKLDDQDGWFSEVFTIRDINWKMKLYPNGRNFSSKGRYLSMFLACVDSDSFDAHRKVKAEFYMAVRGRTSVHSIILDTWFTSSMNDWGAHSFMSLDTLKDPRNDFLVDDCITIEVEIRVQVVV